VCLFSSVPLQYYSQDLSALYNAFVGQGIIALWKACMGQWVRAFGSALFGPDASASRSSFAAN